MIIHLEHFHWMHYCIFLKIVLENYRWNYYDREIHLFLFWWRVARPDPCCVRLIVHFRVASIYFWVQKLFYCFFFFSLWSVNTESTIAINVLYTPYFFMLLRHDAQIFGLIFLNCLFMVSHYISDALDVLFVHMIYFLFFLGPYWMEVSTWKN